MLLELINIYLGSPFATLTMSYCQVQCNELSKLSLEDCMRAVNVIIEK